MDKEITRAAYMAGKISHREFYGEVVRLAGIKFGPEDPLVQDALKSHNPHYNDIPLVRWDYLSTASQARLQTAFKQVGDFWSLAGGVCVYKEAVRQAVEKIQEVNNG